MFFVVGVGGEGGTHVIFSSSQTASYSHMGKLIAWLQYLWLMSLREQQASGVVEELNAKIVVWSSGGRWMNTGQTRHFPGAPLSRHMLTLAPSGFPGEQGMHSAEPAGAQV